MALSVTTALVGSLIFFADAGAAAGHWTLRKSAASLTTGSFALSKRVYRPVLDWAATD